MVWKIPTGSEDKAGGGGLEEAVEGQLGGKRMNFVLRRLLLVVVLFVGIGALGVGLALANIDHWLFDALDPGAFDAQKSPPKPDYGEPSSWAALPTSDDAADVFIEELPALDQGLAAADLFYVHPTTWVGQEWNGPIDDPMVIEATARGGTLIQASAFNACCAVYAPRYRQANGRAYTEPDAEGKRAVDVAYADVAAAFEVFLQHNAGRPFILASHSQGTVLAARLLREEIYGKPPSERLVVAYLIGGPIRPETIGEKATICGSATQTGCVVAWNARGPRYVPNDLEFDAHTPDPMAGRICVNPLTWTHDGQAAPAESNAGALFFDADKPAILPAFADAQCVDGRLLITQLGHPPRDTMSTLLDWMIGPQNYHPIEYQMFYLNLRQNAVERIAAFD
ncbi:MAG: DUF3089 domain-containing protein [Ardenticatenaceae bacterium]